MVRAVKKLWLLLTEWVPQQVCTEGPLMSIAPAKCAPPTHRLALKLGAGVGLTSTSPDFSVLTCVVWRF